MLFGKYCLLERVSVGGMAEIFRAKPFNAPESQKHLALKRILPHLAEDDEFVQMFIDEAKLTVQLIHPNIVRTYELGRFHTSPYILMEFISGQDILELQRKLREQRRIMSVAMCCYIAREIATGLDYVHAKNDENGDPLNIIHRDISPQNVLVTYGGKVKIIDFGIAKGTFQETRTQVGVLKGKFGYMSPEQVRGEAIDHRSDLFSVGILLWEMLTNRRLFRGDNEYETLQMVRDPDIAPPSQKNSQIPPEVDRIVAKALAADANERFQSGRELAAALDSFLMSLNPPYGAENLSQWMADMFSEPLAAERQKRQFFRRIRTPDDVRRLAREAEGEDTRPDEDAPTSEHQALWAADISPEENVDVDRFASEHTVVAAGGFDAAQFAAEAEEDVIALDVDDIIEIEGDNSGLETVDLDRGVAVANDETMALSRSDALSSAEFASHGTPKSIPNPSSVRRKRRKKKYLAAAAVLMLLLAGGATLYLWVNRPQGPAPEAKAAPAPQKPATLVISVSPPTGVRITVDGTEKGTSSPVTVPNLEPGVHTLVIEHPHYKSHEQKIELGSGGFESLDIELEPNAQGAR
ncbi:serine/threonine-protein kinase [Persicimonas caeni]|nr:serine/threonine-protein kinase [Persicimonas caeni]